MIWDVRSASSRGLFTAFMKIFSDKKDQTSKNQNPRVCDVGGPARPTIEPEICLQIALGGSVSLQILGSF